MKTRRSSARSIPFARCSFIRAGVACSDSRGSTTTPPSCRGRSTSTASRPAFRPSILRSASSASTRFRRARRCRPSSTSMEPACAFHSRASWSWRARTMASAGRSRVAACGSPSATSPGGTCPRSMTGASSSTFPRPVSSVSLDVEPGHGLAFAGGAAWLTPSAAAPLPAGPRARVNFASPIHQLLLAGNGFLESVRTPLGPPPATQIVVLGAVTGPIPFVDAPLPAPPLFATIANLQQSQPVLAVDQPTAPTPPPHDLGFEIRWRPAPRVGVPGWPPDLGTPPPLDATLFQIEHRQTAPTVTPFEPIIDREENYTTGDRAQGTAAPPVHPGVDLMTVFPEVRAPVSGALDLSWRDVFDFADDGSTGPGVPRPRPPPGTRHRYRVRAVDAIGRPSATWVETAEARLEKRVPPPLPAAPDLKSADQLTEPAHHRRARPRARAGCARPHGAGARHSGHAHQRDRPDLGLARRAAPAGSVRARVPPVRQSPGAGAGPRHHSECQPAGQRSLRCGHQPATALSRPTRRAPR